MVATAVGGIPEVISNGVDGLLVPPADPAALAEAVVQLIGDPERRARIGEAGYRTVLDRFSIDAQVRRTQAMYDEELARAGVLQGGRPIPRGAGRARRPGDAAGLGGRRVAIPESQDGHDQQVDQQPADEGYHGRDVERRIARITWLNWKMPRNGATNGSVTL